MANACKGKTTLTHNVLVVLAADAVLKIATPGVGAVE